MTTLQNAYVVEAVRTPVGKAPKGKLSSVRPDVLLAHVLKNIMAKVPELEPSRVDDVIIGCAMPEAEQGMNVARIGLLLAGLPNSVPGMTVNRFCCSGIQTVALAAQRIMLGQADVMLAGGTESMSMVPLGGHKLTVAPDIFQTDENVAIAYGMGLTAEIVAKQWDISRAEQELFALESHKRAIAAIENGEFKDEIVPIDVDHAIPDLNTGEITHKLVTVDTDEGPRAGSTPEMLAKLRTVFAAKGTVTAATSSQMSDGAGALLLVSEKVLKELKLEPLAQLRSYEVAGVPPETMGIGPIKAIPKALDAAGLSLNDIEWIELNEAFAAQSLAVMKECDLNHDIVNPLGGAIALGHPLGATGALRSATLIHGMRRRKQKYGMVTMCIGTGMGAAGIFEVF